jgi:hypothetical protein
MAKDIRERMPEQLVKNFGSIFIGIDFLFLISGNKNG